MASTPKRIRRSWLLWVCVLIGASVVGLLILPRLPRPGGAGIPTGVETAKAEVGTLQKKIGASGVVASQIGTQVKIGSQFSGCIRELPADVGTHVRAGQIIAVLDAPELEAQVATQRHALVAADAALAQVKERFRQAAESAGYTRDQTAAQTDSDIRRAQATLSTARSSLAQVEVTGQQQILQAQSSVDDAQAAAENAKRTLIRKQQLLKQDFIAVQEVDNSETAYQQVVAKLDSAKAALEITREKVRADLQAAQDTVKQGEAGREAAEKAYRIKKMAVSEARSAVRQAQASVLQARAQLRYQVALLAKSIIRSPIDGIVLSIAAQQGETVAAGFAAPTLITVADLSRLEVRAYVDETDIGRVRLHLPAEVQVDAFPGQVFRGEVAKIASASTVRDNVVTYETTISVPNPAGLLRPDMTADVSLILGAYPNVLMVPSESLHRETTRSIVYVLHAERSGADRVESRVVDAGFDDGSRREIRSGLKAGESVVLAGLARLGVRAPDAQSGGQ